MGLNRFMRKLQFYLQIKHLIHLLNFLLIHNTTLMICFLKTETMAREDEEGGSLDMLLDTLCNTFGGIILIALLLALSVNKKSVELYDKLVKTDDNQSELIREREQLKNSLVDLKDENIEILGRS